MRDLSSSKCRRGAYRFIRTFGEFQLEAAGFGHIHPGGSENYFSTLYS